MAFRSGLSTLAIGRVFGSGKTRSLAFMLGWFAVTTNQQLAAARHPTKANTAEALVEPSDFPALWLDGINLKPANHHSTPNLGHQALLIFCGLHGYRHRLPEHA